MSINLPTVDLSSAIVGTAFTVSLQDVGIPQDFVNSRLPIYIRFFNDSCMGLSGSTQKGGKQFYVPQGAWPTIKMGANETGINFICTSQMLPVPSVCILQPVYYGPGEELDDAGVHGNSPQNLGSSGIGVTTLSNEGNPINTLVFDAGPTGNAQMIQIFNDHFVWSVVQSGVAHQVLAGQISGNPLQIGQAGDVTDVLSNLGLPNNTPLKIKDSTGTYRDALSVDGLNHTIVKGINGGDEIHFILSGGSDIIKITSAGIALLAGKVSLLGGGVSRQNGSVSACSSATVISHGLGAQPDWYAGFPVEAQPGSATLGVSNGGTTTFTATIGAGSQLCWIVGKNSG